MGRRPLHASPKTVTEALAARIHDYAETSAVTALLTRDRGLVHAVAKGARRTRNSFSGPLDRGVLYTVRLGRRGGDGLYHLNSSEVREAFAGLRLTPARFHAAALVLEVASDLMREEEPHPELFRLTVFSLKVCDRAPLERLPLAVGLFLARVVALSGHVPEVGHCVACGKPLGTERPLIGPTRGGALHPACAQDEPGARSVRREVLELLRGFWQRSSGEVLSAEVPKDQLAELRRLLVEWLQHVLERRFLAALPLEREFAASVRIGP